MAYDIDLEHAKKAFLEYLKDFDTKDEKIALKVSHTYRVERMAGEIAGRLNLSEEDIKLARLIGLLHDIGRFVQLKETGSFDDSIIPHAVLSNRILFDEGYIRRFIDDDHYDKIIFESIKNHGLFKYDISLEDKELLHTKIIRDADKLDNFHTKLIEKMETMLDVSVEELEMEEISDYGYDTFMKHEPLVNSMRKTHLDMWISYIAYIYDLNFDISKKIVVEHDYINRLFKRVSCKKVESAQKMVEMRLEMNKMLDIIS